MILDILHWLPLLISLIVWIQYLTLQKEHTIHNSLAIPPDRVSHSLERLKVIHLLFSRPFFLAPCAKQSISQRFWDHSFQIWVIFVLLKQRITDMNAVVYLLLNYVAPKLHSCSNNQRDFKCLWTLTCGMQSLIWLVSQWTTNKKDR